VANAEKSSRLKNDSPATFGSLVESSLVVTRLFRDVHSKTIPCPICGELFQRDKNVAAHLVHAHGHERKYSCSHCPAKFIRHSHMKRHIKNFHADPSSFKNPSIRLRGPNKQPYPNPQTAVLEEPREPWF
jgi:NAD-dependent SIR2 family protein deacetylase